MANSALPLMATFFVACLVSSAATQDLTTTTEAPDVSLEASNDSTEELPTSSDDKVVGSNRILNSGYSSLEGNGFGVYQGTAATLHVSEEYPHLQPNYPSFQQPHYPSLHRPGHGYPTHPKHYNTGCKHYCPGFVPGTFYCCNKAPLYGGYYCPRIRQSCPAGSRHNAPRPCIEDQGCYQGQKCCLDACLGFHVCKAPEWR
ncbi:uncharacterized protein [Panulirus ornatus]|uniref:uncharacterized protein n=1 Tax=Panulirus ornatus TaxID=150431 RepID=UPI003A8C0154